ncbi:galactose-specific lectin nattectin-like [Trematomus bernacchii]|uniref:galactose-specific lectin nattectin-like n=1 Tax=Trematomus bernacchii TaxID=40690 RepID=UPI00146B5B62|nr:galactose-specific lectin nattectin-like [Trematomus bernacchii]
MASVFHCIVLLCLTGGLWMEADASCPIGKGCPQGWSLLGSRCFIFNYEEKEWAIAEKSCTALGGNLASIQTHVEYLFIRQLVKTATGKNKLSWVGSSDAVKDGVWLWSDGSNFKFGGWAKGEPNGQGKENCMEINFRESDYVNDSVCSGKKSFVCSANSSPLG